MVQGILRNENEVSPQPKKFDRHDVLTNTEQNAKLGEEGRRLREQLRKGKHLHTEADSMPKTKAPSALKKGDLELHDGFTGDVEFDEDGIREWDKHRGEAERILEPNTPYMGTAKDTEYYDEDPVPDLDLGEHQ